jgi:ribonuclease J
MTENNLHITPLGGLGETGALNCMLYHTESTAILVDCGVMFADDRRHPGANVIIPDFSFLEPYADKLAAVVLTHGHEDHIGALPYLLRDYPLPVYGTDFTRGIIAGKLQEFDIKDPDFRELNYDVPVQIGDFKIDPIFVNHSMMDVAALAITQDKRNILHLTDFKIDHSAPDNRVIDLGRMKKLGEKGLDILLSDSTNSLASGWTGSETKVRANLVEQFTKIKGRILTCLFSSNTYRLQSLIECARLTGRKVALTGRSTKSYARIAMELGKLNTKDVELYDVEDMNKFEDSEVLVIVTGSQAEPRSVLSRMARDMFGPFKIKNTDTLLMSSKMIPGNEGRVLDMLNNLSMLGATIINSNYEAPIHASGHAKQDELKEIIRLTQPKHFIPIHGEYRHLQEHIAIACEEGIKAENCHLVLNGMTWELAKDGTGIVDDREVGRIYVSENINYNISENAIKRRKKLAWNGLIVASSIFDTQDDRISELQFKSEGIFGGDVEKQALEDLHKHMLGLLKGNKLDMKAVKKFLKVEVRRFYKQNYELRPEVIVLTHEV